MISALLFLFTAAADKPLHIDHYDAELSVDTQAHAIHGEETITLTTDAKELHLAAGTLVIHSVMLDGAPLAFRREGETLIVTFARAATAPLRIHLSYDAGPSPSLVFAQDQVFASYHAAAYMVSNSELSDPSTLTLSLIVDASLTTVSVGEPQPSQAMANGKRRDIWKTTTPTSIFLFAFAAGKFHHVETVDDGLHLHYYSAKRSDAELAHIFETTPKILHNFYDVTQTPLPAKTYRQVLVEGDIAQEANGMALIGENYATTILEDPMEDWVIAHELAHQFFGVALQMGNWADFWLNEGFATFMTAIDKERRYGLAEYAREIALALKRMSKAEGRGRDHALVVPNWKIPEDASGAVAYSKGTLFLHTLRTALGDKEFFSRLARYTAVNIGHRVSTRDLAAVMNREPLFQKWAFTNQAVATAEPLSVALSSDLVVTQLDEGVYRATHAFPYPANALIVEVADGTLVVCDTLYSPDAANLLLDWLNVRFVKRQVVAIDTHFHNDRIGGNAAFLARGIPVWAGDRTNALIANRGEAIRKMVVDAMSDPKLKNAHQEIVYVPADHVFPTAEGKTFDFGGEKVDVHFFGEGHSPDNVVVYFPKRHLLDAGCLTIPSGKLGNTSDANVSEWPKTVARLEALGATRVISGHGELDQAAEVFRQTERALKSGVSK